jgi:glutamyl-tRNA synthetase
MTIEELTESFSLDGIPKHPAVFDEKKLLWMNSQYIMTLPVETVADRLMPFLEKQGYDTTAKSREWYVNAVVLYRERAKTMVELAENLDCFFTEDVEYDPAGVKKHFKPEVLKDAIPELVKRTTETEAFTVENLEAIVRQYAEELGISAAKLIHPIRLAITGKTGSPPIFDVMVMAGKDLMKRRLQKAADYIRQTGQTETCHPQVN